MRHTYVRLLAQTGSACAIVETLAPGPDEVIVDPLLRRELKIAEGELVSIEPLLPFAAEQVDIALPKSGLSDAELLGLCRTYLGFQPLSVGQLKPLFLYTGDRVDVEITRVLPQDGCILSPETAVATGAKRASLRCGSFADVGGVEREIRVLRERILRPLRCKELFQSMGIRVPRGILFAGPPGCGKTLLARALSAELGNHCLEVRGPEIFAGVYGESEKRIRELFAEARAKSPSLILIDEIDAVAPSRQNTRGDLERRIVTTLLAEMDGPAQRGRRYRCRDDQ